ncbi:MAG: NAD(P)H-dependent oxidoreductase subunit E [Deltaproteobacteria bacterium]|jgi:NADH-quinone oxidoreductase subunit E|nr:NAD(P)H-dependent oxidoreductase subunit E [Deltaproteobacteria bacterium]
MIGLDEKAVRDILDGHRNDPQQIIAALLDIQEASGTSHVERRWAALTAGALNVPDSRVHEVLSFYSMFSEKPRGRHVAEVCQSSPCLFSGGRELMGWLREALGIEEGETTPDGEVTLEVSGCCGRCAGSPALMVGEEAYTVGSEEDARTLAASFREKNPGMRRPLLCEK